MGGHGIWRAQKSTNSVKVNASTSVNADSLILIEVYIPKLTVYTH